MNKPLLATIALVAAGCESASEKQYREGRERQAKDAVALAGNTVNSLLRQCVAVTHPDTEVLLDDEYREIPPAHPEPIHDPFNRITEGVEKVSPIEGESRSSRQAETCSCHEGATTAEQVRRTFWKRVRLDPSEQVTLDTQRCDYNNHIQMVGKWNVGKWVAVTEVKAENGELLAEEVGVQAYETSPAGCGYEVDETNEYGEYVGSRFIPNGNCTDDWIQVVIDRIKNECSVGSNMIDRDEDEGNARIPMAQCEALLRQTLNVQRNVRGILRSKGFIPARARRGRD